MRTGVPSGIARVRHWRATTASDAGPPIPTPSGQGRDRIPRRHVRRILGPVKPKSRSTVRSSFSPPGNVEVGEGRELRRHQRRNPGRPGHPDIGFLPRQPEHQRLGAWRIEAIPVQGVTFVARLTPAMLTFPLDAPSYSGAWFLFLAPDSTDLNPIEMPLATLKALIRKAAARTYDQVWQAVGDVCDLFTDEERHNFYYAAGSRTD